ncbi:RnfABCDGE type electron transport complex subunit D [Sediminispirochaeta bajacaliforniensis]|uniref:RnfABCDGE type electron transport complex subunit D n=1 Tax=Sediminispirochaeta bajacaliforniensis TaxID=148 RepID=UPI0003A2261A|nr:RnfABCDGE type electron transport complex subunit D [Sediminispirochaeta bajacaliforniensis]
MSNNEKRKPFMQKQPPMISVVQALVPLCLAAVYFFGWRFLLVLALVNGAGILAEYLLARAYGMKVTSSVLVTSFLFALSLPPTVPLWIAVVGIVFGVVFGKMVFGGFGRNVFNPAISGRAFIYISFGVPMTGRFVPPVGGPVGGFAHWLTKTDALSSATPLVSQTAGTKIPLSNLFFGNVAGSFGETCALLIILGGVYIVWKKVANWRLILSSMLAFLLLDGALYVSGVTGAIDPLSSLLSGSFLFAAVFMITDPVSASQTTNTGRWLYGAIFGFLTVLIRVFAGWPEGVTFAILFANMFAPLIDYLLKEHNKRVKEAKA